MSNSPLVNHTKISPNRTSPRTHAIDTITIHCVVGQCSVETLGNLFAQKSRQASSNYGIGPDGRIGMYVEEKDRSWCTSSSSNDNRAITIEVASETTHPYEVTDKAYDALIVLVADICKRNNIKKLLWKGDKSLIGKVSEQNMTVHRWFANKSCPGEYLYSRHAHIASEVNKLLGIDEPLVNVTTTTTPTTSTKPATTTTNNKEGVCFVDVKVLKQGAKNNSVKALQNLLIGYGYSCGASGMDGSFGPATLKAVKAYQADKKLEVDGSVGPATWSSLLGIK